MFHQLPCGIIRRGLVQETGRTNSGDKAVDRKRIITILLITGFATGLVYWAYLRGVSRFTYPVTPLSKEIPLPLLYEYVEGKAIPVGNDKVKVRWKKTALHPHPTRSYMLCIGSLRPASLPYYLLELDGVLYLEKGEFIEPLIHALYTMYNGNENRPASLEKMIAELPDDRERLIALCHRLNKP